MSCMDDHMLTILQHKVAGAHLHVKNRVLAAGQRGKPIIVDHLDIAAAIQ
jgi:hypothetical protein